MFKIVITSFKLPIMVNKVNDKQHSRAAIVNNVTFQEEKGHYLNQADAQYCTNNDLAWAYLLNAKRFY